MRVLAVANQKGGVGKTTTAVNVAACLSEIGRRVLLVDLDSQANATAWLGAEDRGEAVRQIIVDLDPASPYIVGTNTPGVSILPGSKASALVDTDLAKQSVTNPKRVDAHPLPERLRDALQPIRSSDEFDVVIIDTPPSLGFLVSNGIHAADELVIPVESHVIAAAAISRLLESVEAWGLDPMVHIVPVRVDRRNRHTGEVVDRLRDAFPGQVTEAVIRENVRVAEAWGWKEPVTVYDPGSNGTEDYRALTAELFTK